MSDTNAAQLAALLRRTADALDAASSDLTDTPLTGRLYLRPSNYGRPEHDQVLTVHTLARHLGLPADRTLAHGTWEYSAEDDTSGLSVRAATFIAEPPKRCACGQACTHSTQAAATRAA